MGAIPVRTGMSASMNADVPEREATHTLYGQTFGLR